METASAPPERRGCLITVEGTGGSGKSTIVRAVTAWLERSAVPVITTREPGGTDLGRELRRLLLQRQPPPSPWTEAFLFEADRAETYARVILPALDAGRVVVSDRNVYGTVAYQAFGRGIDLDLVERMNRAATLGRWPDLAFVLDVEPSVGLARKAGDRAADRFDAEDLAFQRRVRQGYLHAAAQDAGRAHVIDAAGPAAAVLRTVQQVIAARLIARFPSLRAPEER